MATHSSILAWRIPRTEEPGRLQSMGWQRVGTGLNTLTCTPPLSHNTLCSTTRPYLRAQCLDIVLTQQIFVEYIRRAHTFLTVTFQVY